MKKIPTALKVAAQRVIEAWDEGHASYPFRGVSLPTGMSRAIDALRSALAAPQEDKRDGIAQAECPACHHTEAHESTAMMRVHNICNAVGCFCTHAATFKTGQRDMTPHAAPDSAPQSEEGR